MMFSYIASFLGLQSHSNSTHIDQDHASSQPIFRVSCQGYGWTLPRQDIRLQVPSANTSIVRVFGFPPQEDFPRSMRYPPPTFGTDGPYIHYLFGESPASVKYIMGDDWRSRLQSDLRDPPEGDVILRPSVTRNDTCNSDSASKDDLAVQAEERVHSLRMRRCGAVAVFSKRDIIDYDARQVNSAPRYLFGWPEGGGVWVMRSPWSDPPPERSADLYRTDEELMEEVMRTAERDEVYYALAAKIKLQETMEDACQVLEEARARFYPVIEDSPEAVELNLC